MCKLTIKDIYAGKPDANEIPEINYKDANIIHFTKEKNNGRYGFLLDVAD